MDALVLPVLSPSGAIHFVSLQQDATVHDALRALRKLEDILEDVLADLKDGEEAWEWAMQRVVREESGKSWEEEELEGLDDDILYPDTPLQPLLSISQSSSSSSTTSSRPTFERHFSAFPLTSHLHSPCVRIISLHPYLRLNLSFTRVPDIHDGFEWTAYLARGTTAREVVESIVERFGLMRQLSATGMKGGGEVVYVLEQCIDEESTRLNPDTLISPIVASAKHSSHSTRFIFCVPDEWFRRSSSASRIRISAPTLTPTESTLKRLSDLEAEDVDDVEGDKAEGEGTARAKQSPIASPPASPTEKTAKRHSDGSGGTFSSRRFSSMFEGWLGGSSSPSVTPGSPQIGDSEQKDGEASTSTKKMMVSEPMILDAKLASPGEDDEDEEPGLDEDDFEQMINDLGLKGEKRNAMLNLPADRKRYLLRQNRQMRSASSSATIKSPVQSATINSPRGSPVTPALVPNLTGDSGMLKRFSVTSWATGGSQSPAQPSTPTTPLSSSVSSLKDVLGKETGLRSASPSRSSEAAKPLEPQSTGSLWNSWWSSSGSDSWVTSLSKTRSTSYSGSKDTSSPAFYADGLRARSNKPSDTKLVKHLISLRVHLSTAKVSWVDRFLGECKGMDALSGLLKGLVGKGGKRRKLNETEESVTYEVVKCLRVLLNTEPGFNVFIASPELITHVTYTLHAAPSKLRTLACELLAAICLLAVPAGHRLVLAAFSDYCVAHEEAFRFEELIGSLRLSSERRGSDESEVGEETHEEEEEGRWEARTSAMTLVNAFTTCPESLEERIQLREELGRRGLNEIIVTLRYIRPPEAIVTQIDVYTEEKFEDEEDLRERTRSVFKSVSNGSSDAAEGSEFELTCMALNDIVGRYDALRPLVLDVLRLLTGIVGKEDTLKLKADILSVLRALVTSCAVVDGLGENWVKILEDFLEQANRIIDGSFTLKVLQNENSSEEYPRLADDVKRLETEKATLQQSFAQLEAEIQTLRSISIVPEGGKQSIQIQGLVQRLVAKEKQVVQLQSDLRKLKAAAHTERDDQMQSEKDKIRWNSMTEELSALKRKLQESESAHLRKDKEVTYLKRAMESVYSRLSDENKQPETQAREAPARDFDAEQIASRAVEALSIKDDQIASLRAEVDNLQEQLKARPAISTESAFKKSVAPPPPPLPVVNGILKHAPALPSPLQTSTFPDPSAPPPTPPFSPTFASISPPPPPPPPPPMSPSTLSPPPPPPPPPTGMPGPPPPPGIPPPPPIPHLNVPKSDKRLKPFFWTKVARTAPSTGPNIWDDVLSSESLVDVDLKNLEDAFAVDSASSKNPVISASASNVGQAQKKASTVTLLDVTRANNISIMLRRIRISLADIEHALLTIDDSMLSTDDLKAISRHIPTAEEIRRIEEFGDPKQLDRADQYLKEISGIHRLPDRIACMLYRRRLELDIEEVRPELDIVRSATKELKSSERFKQVLKTILVIGNTLNGSSFRGNARGFQLEALLKMKETKTAKPTPDCPTLLHYIARLLLTSDAERVNFLDDMPHLEAAARISMQAVSGTVSALSSGLAQVRAEIKAQRQARNTPPEDRFVLVMEPFVVKVTSSIQALENMNRAVDAELKSVMVYFGEDAEGPEGPKPEDLFSLIISFSSLLRKAALEVHEAQMRAERLSAGPTSILKNSKLSSTSHTPTTVQLTSPSPSPSPAVVPQLLKPPTAVSRADGLLIPTHPPVAADASNIRYGSVGRGDLDETIKTMRRGVRRDRARPLSKIFLDGT